MSHRKHLTNEQKEILQENFLFYPLLAMARIFGCSFAVLKKSRNELQLVMPSEAPTTLEVGYFLDRYGRIGDVDILAVSLGRSKGTIRRWACKLKAQRPYSRPKPLTKEEEQYLIDNYKTRSDALLAADLCRRRTQIKKALSRLKRQLGLPMRARNRFFRSRETTLSPEQELYLRRHYKKGDLRKMSEELNISQSKLVSHAREMGLSRPRRKYTAAVPK